MRHVDRRREMKDSCGGGEKNHIRIKRDFMSPYVLCAQCFWKALLRNIGELIMELSCLYLCLYISCSLTSHIQFILKSCQSYLQNRSYIWWLLSGCWAVWCQGPRLYPSLLSGHSGRARFSDSHIAIRPGM